MRWEENLKEWIRKNALLFGYLALAALGLFLRYSYLPMLSADVEFINTVWFEGIKSGGMSAVLDPQLQFNYTPMHLYLWMLAAQLLGSLDTVLALKIVCLCSEAVLLVGCFLIIRRLTANRLHRLMGFGALMLNPVLLWNAAGWGQMDVTFASMSILAVWLLMNEKPQWGLAALGVALAFKMQAAFILPLFMYAWFQSPKKFSIFWFLLVPGIWIASGIPMVLVGASPLYAVQTYFGQTGLYSEVTYNYPNIYAIMGQAIGQKSMVDGMISRTGLAMAIALFGGLAVWMLQRRIVLKDKPLIVLLGAWCVLIAVFFLPRMHERYAIVGELLLLCWAVWLARPRGAVYVVLSVLPILSAYSQYLLQKPFFSLQLGGAMNLLLVAALTWELVQALRAQPAVKTPVSC